MCEGTQRLIQRPASRGTKTRFCVLVIASDLTGCAALAYRGGQVDR